MISTDQFEVLLLSAVLKDGALFSKLVGLADPQLFSSSLSSELFDLISVFHKQYVRIPARDELIHLYKRDKVVDDDKIVVNYIDVLYSAPVDSNFVRDELSRYVRLRKLEGLFKGSYEKVKSGGDLDVSATVSDLFRIQQESLKDKHVYGVGLDESEYLLAQEQSRVPIPTNIGYLNRLLNGGLSAGQLGIVLAPPNHGKTMTLLNFALYAFLKRNNVLFVTLEMLEFSLVRRSMMLLAGFMHRSVDMVVIKEIVKVISKQFRILYRPTKSITVEYLYSVFHQAEADGIRFDAVYIDYADCLQAQARYKDRRFELADVFSSLKAFAQVLDVPVWSATQSNREGLRAETVDMSHMSESIDKAFVSDVILSLSDKVEAGKVSKFFLTKHREGVSDKYIDVSVDNNMWFDDAVDQHNDINLNNA